MSDPSKLHYFWRIQHALVDILEESEQRSVKLWNKKQKPSWTRSNSSINFKCCRNSRITKALKDTWTVFFFTLKNIANKGKRWPYFLAVSAKWKGEGLDKNILLHQKPYSRRWCSNRRTKSSRLHSHVLCFSSDSFEEHRGKISLPEAWENNLHTSLS